MAQPSVAGVGVVDGAPPEHDSARAGNVLTVRLTETEAAVPVFGVAFKVPE
jgi:hypothetical protein